MWKCDECGKCGNAFARSSFATFATFITYPRFHISHIFHTFHISLIIPAWNFLLSSLMRLLILSFFLLPVMAVQAQKVTGSWYGVADVAGGGMGSNNYLTELVLKQK